MLPPVHPRIPLSTYRVQLNRHCTFRQVADLIPYLHELGITDLYCSPYFTAVPGSLHGYDVVDPTTLNPEIGQEEDYGALIEELHRRGMGQILDVVPNHMGIARQINAWWQDVLENGPSSPFAAFFDIDWNPVKPELRDKVLLPILGDHYGIVLENQELQLEYREGRFFINYYDHCLPVAPKPASLILAHRLPALVQERGPNDPHVMELESIITALRHLPSREDRTPEFVHERYREKEIIKRRLAALVEGSGAIRVFLDENVRLINGTKGDPPSFDLLDDLLNEQAYRLAYWRVAAEEINYRRFFDINELAAIRMEDPTVFNEANRLLFQLLKEGAVTGVRVDHVDGLYDPADYLHRLQRWAASELPLSSAEASDRPLYVLVEKILGIDEELPGKWPVFGTTGYDFLAWLNALFVDGTHERLFSGIYTRVIGREVEFHELAYRCKQLIMGASMASELNVLGHQLNRLSERDRRSRDFTLNSLTHAIQEIMACFPAYRTYITEGPDGILDRDRVFVWQAVTHAKRRNPALSGLVFDFVRDLLLKPFSEDEPHREERVKFVMKFQQTTSPVTAKGVEDTAFYRYHRFVSLNEVGSDPQQFGITPSLVHEQWKSRQTQWPAALSSTSTHDTKRSEDVRARLNVLSELPKEWKDHVIRWRKLTRRLKAKAGGEAVPGPNEEYLLYQTLIGVWPLEDLSGEDYDPFVERIQISMNKAVKEAKEHTSWVSPDLEYEDALRQFIQSLLRRDGDHPFLDDFLPFQRRIAQYGLYNSLSQLVIKMAAPGVPDFYQGTELWDFSLVDPDNRRPVDFHKRVALLADLTRTLAVPTNRLQVFQDLFRQRVDGRIKLFIMAEALRFRRDHPALFRSGGYVPLEAQGLRSRHVFAFARVQGPDALLCVVPRFLAQLVPDVTVDPLGDAVWKDSWLTMADWGRGAQFRDIFTGNMLRTANRHDRSILPLGEIFLHAPIAWLEKVA